MRPPRFESGPRASATRRRARRPRLEAVERRVLLSTFTVWNTADDGEGSLRWAIVQANHDDGPSRIDFDIGGEGEAARTIRLTAALDPLTRPVVIDGRSQPGYDGRPLIRLDGSALAAGSNGLVVAGGESLIAGLVVTGFSGAGIVLTGGGGNLVESSYVGVDPTGGRAAPNGVGVLIAGSSHNAIGGVDGGGNLISGNAGAGVKIITAVGGESVGNLIAGNRIGTDAAGSTAIGNQAGGVAIAGGRGGLIVGNLISGNRGAGLALTSAAADNAVVGNMIGLTADGARRLGNLNDGVWIDSSPRNRIGGLSADEGNLISGNQGSGVRASGGSAGLVVQGNRIGTDASGRLALGNLGDGVTLASGSNLIGGEAAGAGNVIANNGVGSVGAGVRLVGLVTGNSILSNSIHDNAGLGIDLGNGPTPNHQPGEGPGPNNWQNYPILSTALIDGAVARVTGRLSGAAGQTYLVQLFWNDQPDLSGFGEGRRYLGSRSVTVDSTGGADFTITAPLEIGAGYISATATDAEGNTSEFSQAILAVPSADLSVSMTAAPSPAKPGEAITFTVVAANRGNLEASDIVLSARFESSATIVSASTTRGSAVIGDGAAALARVGSLAPGESAIFTLVVQPRADFTGDFSGSVRATLGEIDSNPDDNEARATVRVEPPETPPPTDPPTLSLALTPPSVVYELSTFQYALAVTNTSSRAADDVALMAPLPSGLEFVSATTSWGADAGLDSGRVVAGLESLAAGATATLTIAVRPTAGAGADLALLGDLTCPDLDPDAGVEPVAFTARVLPSVNLLVQLEPMRDAIQLGDGAYWNVDVRNAGPSPASGVVLRLPIAGAGDYVGAIASQGTIQTTAEEMTVFLGTIAPGSVAIVAALLSPKTPGAVSLTATVAADQHDLDPADNASSAGLSVVDWPGSIGFGASAAVVAETVGAAVIPVERSGGSLGAVTVRYQTMGGSAVAGVDYQPVSGVLTFGPGETLKYVSVPILANPHGRGDATVGLVLDAPAGGAVLGGQTVAQLTIRDLDPDFVPPGVAAVGLLGGPTSITGLTITFSEPLNPATARDGSAYRLIDLGPSGVPGGADNRPVAFSPPTHDPASRTVTLTPLQPLAADRSYAIVLAGAGPSALIDLAGNPLAGGLNGIAGTDYISVFTRGAALGYTDSKGNLVSIRATGGGFLDLTRTAAGDARVLTLQGGIPGRTTLTGSVPRRRGRGDGVTTIDAIEGLGQFGQIRVNLKSPPFLIKRVPFNLTVGRPLPIPSPGPGPIRPVPPRLQAPIRPAARPMPIRQALAPPRIFGPGMRRG